MFTAIWYDASRIQPGGLRYRRRRRFQNFRDLLSRRLVGLADTTRHGWLSVRKGYDIEQVAAVRAATGIPLIASGGAGALEHFKEVFEAARVDGALAASVFHTAAIAIPDLKRYLIDAGIAIRPPEPARSAT